MSIRVTIAKWLAPSVFSSNDSLREVALHSARLAANVSDDAIALEMALRKTRASLRNIAALRTPHCANVGKRMADIADEALR